MKKLFIILFSIIMISFNGCRANSSELIENDNSKNNAKLVEAIFAVTGLDNSNEDKYTYYYEDLNDDNSKSIFSYTTLDIPDLSGLNPETYAVYYYIPLVPFGSKATFTLTI